MRLRDKFERENLSEVEVIYPVSSLLDTTVNADAKIYTTNLKSNVYPTTIKAKHRLHCKGCREYEKINNASISYSLENVCVRC